MPEANLDTEKEIIKIKKEDFYFNTGLYDKIKILNLDEDIFKGEVEGFSPSNKIETTFTVYIGISYNIYEDSIYERGYSPRIYYNDIYKITLTCKRKDEELYFYVYINSDKGYIEKVGQFPSFADMITSKINNKYSKILGEDWVYFRKAIGLFSHGVGIGSYVYLRRIFEELIFETFNDNKTDLEVSEVDFLKLHMDEKVETLKGYLPSFLVKHKKIYSVLSIGLHELDEKKCLKYFPVIKNSVILILDQKIEIKEKKKKKKLLNLIFRMYFQKLKNNIIKSNNLLK